MTEQEQKAFDIMREALENIVGYKWPDPEMTAEEYAREALTAANAVQPQAPTGHDGKGCNEVLRLAGRAYPRTCKACGHGPCNWKAAANAVSEPQAQGEEARCGGRSYCSRMPFCGCGGPEGLPERDTSKPAKAQGLFRKFDVTRTDGSSAPGGKHHGCEYFVLDVDHDPHAKAALQAYALACASTHPQLSADLIDRYGVQPQAQGEQDRESERAAFEADAEPLGFDLLRVANPNVEPWDDYLEMETGMRWGGWLARAAHPKATEPAGWKLVPVKPTPEMLDVWVGHYDGSYQADECYRQMLAAAPEAP